MPHKDPEVRRAYYKRYREENREARRAADKRYREAGYSRRNHLKTRYDLSTEEYIQMLIDQAGLCYMCEKPMTGKKDPQVDHDHKTGFVRALLCLSCNRGLHYVEEHERFFEVAKDYLEKFPRW